ncbi:MAG: amidohydrolase [Burkholderiales bacterium]|nr:MAG: amidohydrolase [Burkholderiales bacterium]
MTILIYEARRIHTMNPAQPTATHVAIRDGRILGAGSLDSLTGWGTHTLDRQFADRVLMPGFVEGHSHLIEGAIWRHVYVGYHDRTGPDGVRWPGAKSMDDVIARLRDAQACAGDPGTVLVGWGFDPIHLGERRCTRHDLDQISTERPVALLHASLHTVNANTATLRAASLLRAGLDHPGIPVDDEGLPAGELKGPDPIAILSTRLGLLHPVTTGVDAHALRSFARLCVRAGVTTATDLASPLSADEVETMRAVTGASDFPTRIVALLRNIGQPVPELIERARALRAESTEMLRLGAIKMVADGSIQGFSARIRWPGYFNGAPNGLWYTAPEQARALLAQALEAGLLVHTHTNGDEATEMVLDAMQAALARHYDPDHRFTLQHCQLADAAQFRRMHALGMCVNLFANHIYYWGDAHAAQTVGPERAQRMNACATAIATGVPFAVHSDAPITPLGPLFTAWCAVNRITSTGRLLGADERIPVDAALRAITLGAAYTLKLDGEIGSIECGKRADFAVLEDDPYELDPQRLHEARVWGVVSGGRPFGVRDL